MRCPLGVGASKVPSRCIEGGVLIPRPIAANASDELGSTLIQPTSNPLHWTRLSTRSTFQFHFAVNASTALAPPPDVPLQSSTAYTSIHNTLDSTSNTTTGTAGRAQEHIPTLCGDRIFSHPIPLLATSSLDSRRACACVGSRKLDAVDLQVLGIMEAPL